MSQDFTGRASRRGLTVSRCNGGLCSVAEGLFGGVSIVGNELPVFGFQLLADPSTVRLLFICFAHRALGSLREAYAYGRTWSNIVDSLRVDLPAGGA